jgi:hypothetical protein
MNAGFTNGPLVVIAFLQSLGERGISMNVGHHQRSVSSHRLWRLGRGGISMNAGSVNGPSSSRRLSVHTNKTVLLSSNACALTMFLMLLLSFDMFL